MYHVYSEFVFCSNSEYIRNRRSHLLALYLIEHKISKNGAARYGNEVLVYFTVEWGNSLYNWVKLHLRSSKLENIPNLLTVTIGKVKLAENIDFIYMKAIGRL